MQMRFTGNFRAHTNSDCAATLAETIALLTGENRAGFLRRKVYLVRAVILSGAKTKRRA